MWHVKDHQVRSFRVVIFLLKTAIGTISDQLQRIVEFPQSQARASEVIPTQVLQGTRKKRVR
jgi:hypothetical protein